MLSPLLVLLAFQPAAALLRCGSYSICRDSETCVSSKSGAGRKFGCAPAVNATICDDERFSCPANFVCDVVGEKCHLHSESKPTVQPLLENVQATASSPSGGTGLCNIISGGLPASCTCADKAHGGTVNCRLAMLKSDRLGLQLNIAPCDDTAHLDLEVTEASHGINFTVAGISAGDEKDFPIPGLSVFVPNIGHAGLDVSVEVAGNMEQLRLEVGLDACAKVANKKVCGSSVTKHLPYWVLNGTYLFGEFCKQQTAGDPIVLI